MRKIYFASICLAACVSCEKVWVEDLQEQAYDKIRGVYEIESAVWEGEEPIDIDGDGNATFDYYSEWNDLYHGSPCFSNVSGGSGSLGVPYAVDSNDDWNGPVSLTKRSEHFKFKYTAMIEGEEPGIEFILPSGSDAELRLTGYGELTLRTKVTCTVKVADNESEQKEGNLLIRYVRTRYKID